MKLNIMLFGGRGASSGGGKSATPKKATFTTAIYNAEKGGRMDIEVKGVSYRYKGIDIGIYGKRQNQSEDILTPGRGEDNYVAIILSNDKTNGLMIESGKTRKQAIENANKLIDNRKKDILRAMGRGR